MQLRRSCELGLMNALLHRVERCKAREKAPANYDGLASAASAKERNDAFVGESGNASAVIRAAADKR
jgi:hypothetical protein